MEILGWHDTPLRSVMHSVTSVSRWPGVMCYGNRYLLWERVNKAGKTHKIPRVNRVWAGGKKWVWEKERERPVNPECDGRWSWWWWWVTFALRWAETELAPLCLQCGLWYRYWQSPWHVIPGPMALPLITGCHDVIMCPGTVVIPGPPSNREVPSHLHPCTEFAQGKPSLRWR